MDYGGGFKFATLREPQRQVNPLGKGRKIDQRIPVALALEARLIAMPLIRVNRKI